MRTIDGRMVVGETAKKAACHPALGATSIASSPPLSNSS
jgi:hypothetical protein